MIKAGLLGFGFIGKVHYENGYNQFDNIALDAVFDIDEANIKHIENARKYTNLDLFFEKEKGKLDYIDICLPTYMHKDVTIKAMEYGFNVLCEKPMALSYNDAADMVRASEKHEKKLMIAQVLRFDDDYITLKDYINSNKLGRAKNVKYTSYREGLPQGHNNWFKNTKLSGGSVFDIHIHDADMIINLFGMPKSLSTIANSEDINDGMNSFSTNMNYGNNLIVNIQCDFSMKKANHNKGRNIFINFENGYIVKNDDMFIAVDDKGNESDLTLLRKENYNPDRMYYNEILYFAESVKNNTLPNLCPPFESLDVIKTVCSEILSAKEDGKKVIF